MKKNILMISIIYFMFSCLMSFAGDVTKTLLTYYPSPVGVYESIKIGGGGTSSTGQTYFLEMLGCSSDSNMPGIFGETSTASVISSQYPIIIAVEDIENNSSKGDNAIYILEKGVYISTKNGNTPSPDFFVGDVGNIGIGTNDPTSFIHAVREGNTNPTLTLELCSNTNIATPKIILARNGGTITAKAAPPSDGMIGEIVFKGFPHTKYDIPNASIEVKGKNYPDTEFKIKTADVTRDSNNVVTGVSGPTEKFVINNKGDVWFKNLPPVITYVEMQNIGTNTIGDHTWDTYENYRKPDYYGYQKGKWVPLGDGTSQSKKCYLTVDVCAPGLVVVNAVGNMSWSSSVSNWPSNSVWGVYERLGIGISPAVTSSPANFTPSNLGETALNTFYLPYKDNNQPSDGNADEPTCFMGQWIVPFNVSRVAKIDTAGKYHFGLFVYDSIGASDLNFKTNCTVYSTYYPTVFQNPSIKGS